MLATGQQDRRARTKGMCMLDVVGGSTKPRPCGEGEGFVLPAPPPRLTLRMRVPHALNIEMRGGGGEGVVLPAPPPRLPARMHVLDALNVALCVVKV